MKKTKDNIKRMAENFYLVFIMVFLYAPIATLMVLSFSGSKSRTQWGDFLSGGTRRCWAAPPS